MNLLESNTVFSKVYGLESVDSTNLELERLYSAELPEFTVVIAAEQTAGKGRLGRSWQSAPGASLSMSVLIRPTSNSEQSWLTLIASLSVTEALIDLGIDCGIKWPNDVLIGGKKVCGILAAGLPNAVIVGMGINLKSVPGQLESAVALDELDVQISLDEMAASVGRKFRLNLQLFRTQPVALMEQFRVRCLTLGQRVRAEFPDGSNQFGIAEKVNSSGQLVILTPEPLALSAADVWHLRN